MRRLPSPVTLALAVTSVMLLGACTPSSAPGSSSSSAPTAPVTAEPTPLAAYETSGVAVTRGPFCDRVSPTGIEHAIGGIAKKDDSWEDGQAAPVGDRGHEYGCSWSRHGATAQAWVFAPPVTPAQARRIAAEEATQPCRPVKGQPAFGKPGVVVRCGVGVVRFAGLFGDAWLTCELTLGTPEQLSHRPVEQSGARDLQLAGEWCVTVLQAART